MTSATAFPWPQATWGHIYAPEVDAIHEECFGAEVSFDVGEPVLDPSEHDTYQWLEVSLALALLRWLESQEALRQITDLV